MSLKKPGLQVGRRKDQTTLSNELKKKSNTRTNLIKTIDKKDLYTRGINGDKDEQEFKKLL